jgi:hypothetical protein
VYRKTLSDTGPGARTLTLALFEYYNQVDQMVDIQKFRDGYLVNKEDALGLEIDVEMYSRADIPQ